MKTYKIRRRKEAEERQVIRNKRTESEQLKVLYAREGCSRKELDRLHKKIAHNTIKAKEKEIRALDDGLMEHKNG